MQIDSFTDNTVKVTLDSSDMSCMNISYSDLCSKNRMSGITLSKILEAVKNSGHPDFSGERLFVEAFAGGDGGCKLYISRLGSALGRSRDKEIKPRCEKPPIQHIVAQSDSIDDIARLCVILGRRCPFLSSRLFCCGRLYRLCVSDTVIGEWLKAVISEYCDILGSSEKLVCETEEYFNKLCDNAVNTIANSIG